MKNEYQIRNQLHCIHSSNLIFTVEREDLVHMLGFCPAVNGDGELDGNGRAEATDAIPSDKSMAEILEGLKEGKGHWEKLLERLGPHFKTKLGVVWADLEKPPYPPGY